MITNNDDENSRKFFLEIKVANKFAYSVIEKACIKYHAVILGYIFFLAIYRAESYFVTMYQFIYCMILYLSFNTCIWILRIIFLWIKTNWSSIERIHFIHNDKYNRACAVIKPFIINILTYKSLKYLLKILGK